MKYAFLFGLLALAVLMLAASVLGDVSPTGVEAASNSVVEGVRLADTPEPERIRPYRSYPAPTGEAGFRRYYQKRCYPGCHYGYAVVTPAAAADAHEQVQPTPTRVRYYRSYPAPTGEAGFRRYYQKRCYPGCHYGEEVVTPVATRVHP